MRTIKSTFATAGLAFALLLLLILQSGALQFSSGQDALQENISHVIFIESPGCTKCAAAERVLEKVGQEVPINVSSYYYYSPEGHRIIKEYGSRDVPSIIIGSKVINYRDYEEDDALLEKLILGALANQTPPVPAQFALVGPEEDENATEGSGMASDEGSGLNLKEISAYSISAVLGAGLVAGFNPCLLGILVFLAATVLSSSGKKRELVMMVAFFSLGIFTMYFLFGLGMQRLLETESVANSFRYVLTAFLLLAGLSQVWDGIRLQNGKRSLFRTDWALPYFQAGVSNGRYSSYFLIGALFSLVKAPCVGAIYLAILDLLSTRNYFEGASYLFFFNLGVVLPILIIGGGIALGMSPEQVDEFRKNHRVGMRLVTGVTLIALAPLIYWQLI
jgi:cytochrome c biogenesis protein CcdA/thiol-disulfide isomerase/thioredoxin